MSGKFEPKIYCAFKKSVPLAELQPHPKNPKRHPYDQIAVFAEIIRANGIRRPITISNLSGCIVAGHGLFQTLQKLGVESAPVDYQDFTDEAHELAHMVADNKLAEYGVLDENEIKSIIGEIEDGGLDSRLAGILTEIEDEPTVREIKIEPPPKMAWALIGIPIQHFAKVQALLDQFPKDAQIHTTVNDHADHKS